MGTLGFADELLALVACPVWGLISDRIGVRAVAVAGYSIIGVSLFCLVRSTTVYPEMLVGRLMFSVGGSACSTMVTAILPSMLAERIKEDEETARAEGSNGDDSRPAAEESDDTEQRTPRIHRGNASVSSELTITEARYISRSRPDHVQTGLTGDRSQGSSQLAGFVGLFTGAGALVALILFLPLPAYLQERGQSQTQSLQSTYYFVATIAFVVAVFIALGLRNLPGEESKRLGNICQVPYDETTSLDREGNIHTTLTPAPSYVVLARGALKLGIVDSRIFLGYAGGFVARASSVGISLFIPLFVNAYFVREGLCQSNPENLPDVKKNCQQAYTVASALGGMAETAALICAPLFGWLGSRAGKSGSERSLLAATAAGVAGYALFGHLQTPDYHREGGQWALLAVILIGISQIGCIVCSLALLGQGIHGPLAESPEADARSPTAATLPGSAGRTSQSHETAALLPNAPKDSASRTPEDRARLKGSVAGIYSFCGGAGILILTKVGGKLSDSWSPGAPFFIMAMFNAALLLAVGLVAVVVQSPASAART